MGTAAGPGGGRAGCLHAMLVVVSRRRVWLNCGLRPTCSGLTVVEADAVLASIRFLAYLRRAA